MSNYLPNMPRMGMGNSNGIFRSAANTAVNTASNTKTRVTQAISSALGNFKIVLGLVVLVFVLLVLYNNTVGTYVSQGWDRLVKLVKGKTDISVAIDPGNTGTPVATVDVVSAPPPPALTATLVPEPVTVAKPEDTKPTDGISVPPEDRPAGMPGSEPDKQPQGTLSEKLSSSVSESLFKAIHGDETKIDGEKDTPTGSNQVYNISKNIYTFDDAAAVCAAAGGELATYDQVKAAYEGGADWCNYGWIKGQMAVYPTQKSTYAKLQKGAAEFRDACGVPGVNGGYFDNPDLRFGVTCYGPKPAKKASDEVLDSQVALPQSAEEIEFEKRVQRFRDQMDASIVMPFKKGQWSE